MAEAVLALGSNLGDSAAILQGAVDLLAASLTVRAVSTVYQTDPVGGPEQDPYLNAVVLVETTLDPEALLALTSSVENAFERVRGVRWGPRTLDVDIVAYEGLVQDSPDLTLPHPRAHERAFVLIPWADVDPDAAVPGFGSVRDLLGGVDRSGVRPSTVTLRIPDGG